MHERYDTETCLVEWYDGAEIPEDIPVRKLLERLEVEVNMVASVSENYTAAWRNLTPPYALEFLRRRDWKIAESCEWHDSIETNFNEEAPAFLSVMRLVATEVQTIVDEAKTLKFDFLIEEARQRWFRSTALGRRGFDDPFESKLCRSAFVKMLDFALKVRLRKFEARATGALYTAQTTEQIEQIRRSLHAHETAYWVKNSRYDSFLPPDLTTAVPDRHCLAVTVPDEWFETFPVTFECPTVAILQQTKGDQIPVLEFASGTILVDASRVMEKIRNTDGELPVLFIGTKVCALAMHRFTSLIDAVRIDDALRDFNNQRKSLPVRDGIAQLPNGKPAKAIKRLRLFASLLDDLTLDPDYEEPVPF